MANAPKNLCRVQIGTSSTTLYTTPAATTTIITHIAICNVTALAVTFNLANVPSGGSETAANRFMSTSSVPPNTTVFIDLAMVLAAAESLRGTASTAAALTIVASGVEVT
jgi:hypothetical protein